MIPLNAAGFVEGNFFAPVSVADAQLRLVTEGGDGATSAVLGHVSALVYLRGDPTSLCPDIPGQTCPIPAATEMVNIGIAPFQGTLDVLIDYLSTSSWADTNYYSIITNGNNPSFLDSTRKFNKKGGLSADITKGGDVMQNHISLYFDNFPSQNVDEFDNFPATDMIAYTVCEFEAGAYISAGGAPFVAPLTEYGQGLMICELQDDFVSSAASLFVRNDRLYLDYTTYIFTGTHTQVNDLGPFNNILGGQGVRAITLRAKRTSATTKQITLYINQPCETPVLVAQLNATCDAGEDDFIAASFFDSRTDYATDIEDLGAPTQVWWWQVATDEDPTLFGLLA